MNEQIEKTINELNELQSLLTKKRECEWYLSTLNKNSFIRKEIGDMQVISEPTKPEKRKCTAKEPNYRLKQEATGSGIVYAVLAIIFILIFIAYLRSKSDIGKGISMVGLWIFGFPLVAMLFKLDENVLSLLRKYKQQEDSFNAEIRSIDYFNNVEYPKLIKKYEDELKQYEIKKKEAIEEHKQKEENAEKDWNEKASHAQDELLTINEKISNYSSLLDKKYYDQIPAIIAIFKKEELGVKNVKEALIALDEIKKLANKRFEEQKKKEAEEEMLLLQRKTAGAARCSSCRNRFDCGLSRKGNERALECNRYS